MNIRVFLTLLAAFIAATAAASTRADERVAAASTPPAKCRLVTGTLKTNFGTLAPASVTSQPQAAVMDYRCAENTRAGRDAKTLPVALYWTVASAEGAIGANPTVATTFGTGGILGIAQPGQTDRGFVSVVIAP